MKKNKKEGTIDLFYLNNENVSKSKRKKKKSTQQTINNKKPVNKNIFNFDDEIVIGVTKLPDKKEKPKNKNKVKKQKPKENKKIDNNKKNIKQKNKIKQKKIKENKKLKPKRKLNTKKIKWIVWSVVLVTSFIILLLSPIFNITQINIINNNKISKEEIISLSKIQLNENMFKINKNKIKNNIKENNYIEKVEIKRKLLGTIEITVEERISTFMIEFAGAYIYINNQGYMLEISEEKLELPIIVGISTSVDKMHEGSRLNQEDLEKLATVLKIVETASNNEIGNLITQIDIEDKNNYKIILESQNKIAYLGDCTELTTRILYLKEILQRTKDTPGEIFINGDINKKENVVFRKSV